MTTTRYDSIPLNDTYFTKEGYLIDTPILTGVGVFEYKTNGKIRRELRLPEHVFKAESLATYEGKPIIVTHNAGEVNKDNVEGEAIGTILTGGFVDGNNVRAKIIIHGANQLKQTGYRELSLCYTMNKIEQPGEYNGEHYDVIQTDIVINNLALVSKARAGEKARLNIDSADTDGEKNILNSKGKEIMGAKELKKRLDGEDVAVATETVKEENADAFGAKPNAEGETGGINTSKTPDELVAEKDAKIAELLKIIEELRAKSDFSNAKEEAEDEGEVAVTEETEKVFNADGIDEIVRERVKLGRLGDKLRLDGLDEMKPLEAKKAVIKKVTPSIRLDGKSEDYINACYELAVDTVNSTKDIEYQKNQIRQSRQDSADPTTPSAVSAREKMIEKKLGGKQ